MEFEDMAEAFICDTRPAIGVKMRFDLGSLV